jgi:hypothetical protein
VNSSTYLYDVSFLSTSATEELGIIVTEESGSWKDKDGKTLTTWEHAKMVYFAANIDAEWRLSAMYWRDAS